MSKTRVALTREISPEIANCELTFLERSPIDPQRARQQHLGYREALASLGIKVVHLEDGAEYPDGVFVEDLAVVLDEGALLSRPGNEARRRESESFARTLMQYRNLTEMSAPGRLDGGDVLRIGKTLYVGLSTRTDSNGVEQLRTFAAPWGYEVHAIEVKGCLHLKTACADPSDETVLINPDWVSPSAFRGMEVLHVDPSEPFAANLLRIGDKILYSSAFPRTLSRLQAKGFDVTTVDISELQKAEAGLTCMSQIFLGHMKRS